MMRALLITAALALSLASSPSFAQCKPQGEPRKAKGSMTEGTFRQLDKINKLIVENKNAEALVELNKMSENKSGYEKAMVLQTMGYVHGGMNNYKKAVEVFQQAVDMDVLPQAAWEAMLFNLGQLYMAADLTDKAIATLERYLCEARGTISPDARIALASGYAEKRRWRDAIGQIDQALAATVGKVKESWMLFKLAGHFELKEYGKCAEVLLTLVSIAPAKEEYWKQLSSILFELKNDKDSMAALALAERQGFINEEKEFRNLANVYLLMDIPFKAGRVLQKGLDAGALKAEEAVLTQLADSWFLAREYEKCETALKKLAEITGKGDVYFRLGQLYLEDEQWKKAIDALAKAAEKGAKKTAQSAFMAGVASYQLKDVAGARNYLLKASQQDETRQQALQWLNYISQQEAAEQYLKDAKAAIEAKEAEAKAKAAAPAPASN